MSKKEKSIFILYACMFAALFVAFTICTIKNHSENYFETSAQSSLTKVLEINELHTLEYRYNSFVIVYASKFNMETFETYNPIIELISRDYSTFKKTDTYTFEIFRSQKLQSLEPDSLYASFLNFCSSEKEFAELKSFLSLSRKNAAKIVSTEKYAVAYEAIITAGINNPIYLDIDRNQKLVTVGVPKAEVIDINVNIPPDLQNKSVIYSDKKYVNTDEWNKEALTACRADIQKKISEDMEFLNLATENARDAITALLRPFETQSDYSFRVLYREEIASS